MRTILQRPDETIRILMPDSVAETLKLRLGLPGASTLKLRNCMHRELPSIPPNFFNMPDAETCILKSLPPESAKEYIRQHLWCTGSEQDDYRSDLSALIRIVYLRSL